MKIKRVSIKNFRGYSETVSVDFADLRVLVGKNDIGKSTFLEALDIFFNEGKACKKIDKGDVNKKSLLEGDNSIEISVEFDSLPSAILIDSSNETTLESEYLLTESGSLRIVKKYPNAGKEKVFISAMHPTNPQCKDLLLKKISDLRKILDALELDCVDKTKSAELRKSIWSGIDDLQLQEYQIEVAKIDHKSIWEQLKSYMPLYTLFQSDRENNDGDSEVQDPMRLAVKEILSDEQIQRDLADVASTVKGRLDKVASRTLEKLKEMNPDIANSLAPKLPDPVNLKWIDVFKNVSIAGDEDIPINKRGSGVKRLILINFFRAEAERRQEEANLPNVIYAIEEPETSQHPEHQRSLIDALVELSRTTNAQVLLTTHSPEIVKRLRFENILLVSGRKQEELIQVSRNELPYPSLNEVNYLAFDELSHEYHNELYGFIDAEGAMESYKQGKDEIKYNKLLNNRSTSEKSIVLSEYIRHQIHHPENKTNQPFTQDQLKKSIDEMRCFIQDNLRV